MGQTDDLLTMEDLSSMLHVPVRTIYAWRYRGEGPRGIRVGKFVRFRRDDVARWLEGRADPPRVSA